MNKKNNEKVGKNQNLAILAATNSTAIFRALLAIIIKQVMTHKLIQE